MSRTLLPAESVSINILAVNQDLGSGGQHGWIVAKADDFMALNPSVVVTVIEAPYRDLADEVDEVNLHSAYIMMVGQENGPFDRLHR